MAVLTFQTLPKLPGPKPKDLTGMEIGKLIVLRPTGEKTRYGIVWVARCECGTEVERTASALLAKPKRPNQIPKSCGCFRKRNRSPKYKGAGDLSSTKFRGIKARAKHRGQPFKISIQYAWNLFLAQSKRCSLTGVPITLDPRDVSKGASTASLDRIDSTKGYVRGNVHWVHVEINYMKHSLPLGEFVTWCQRVAVHTSDVAEADLPTADEPHLY